MTSIYPKQAALLDQYCGQNSGSRFGDGAVVTQLFGVGAGFFQAVPRGYMLNNSLNQMLIKGSPLEARHGKRCRRLSVLLTGFEFGERDRAQTGIEVKVELGV